MNKESKYAFKIKENGKPQISITKKGHYITGFNSNNTFESKERRLCISESKVNSPCDIYERKFVVSIVSTGTGNNDGKYKLNQIDLTQQELENLKNMITEVLDFNAIQD